MKRSLYDDSARQPLKDWMSRKALSLFSRDMRAVVVAAVANGQGGGTVETLSIAPATDWPEVEDDSSLLHRALELCRDSESEVAVDSELTQFAERFLGAAGWLLVVVEHPTTIYRSVKGLPDLQIIASSIPETFEIEPEELQEVRCDLLKAGIETLENPDGRIVPDQ
jgi:hypothetical protein